MNQKNSKPHVVCLIPNTDPLSSWGIRMGGAETQFRSLLPLLSHQNKYVYSVFSKYSAFSSSQNLHIVNSFRSSERTFHRISSSSVYYLLSTTFHLIKSHNNHPIQLFYVFMPGLSALPAVILRLIFRIPILLRFSSTPSAFPRILSLNHKNPPIWFPFYRLFNSFLIKQSDYYHVLNQISAVDLSHTFQIAPNRLFLIPNGIEIPSPLKVSSPMFHQNIASPTFGYVGRLNPEKNLLFLLAIFRELILVHPNIQLHLFGDGPQRQILQDYVCTNHLSPNIHFHGFQQDKTKIYRQFDYFVLPSFSEGFSNSLLEALIFGKIPLLSQISSHKSFLRTTLKFLTFSPRRASQALAQFQNFLNIPISEKQALFQSLWGNFQEYDLFSIYAKLERLFEKIIQNLL